LISENSRNITASAEIFYRMWKKAREDKEYRELKKRHRERYERKA
jgi:hypothetical protein